MRYTYVTALVDFSISETLKAPVEIRENLLVTNNPQHIAMFMSPHNLISIGVLESTPLTNGTPVLFQVDEVKASADVRPNVIQFLREVQAFITAAWLIEDSSVNCELAFGFARQGDHVHSNHLALQYSSCSGIKLPMRVTREQLTAICDWHRRCFKGIREEDRPEHTAFRKGIARLDRAIRFLQQARASEDVGQKIANYCSFFEALLSTTSSELSHQLSERISFFLSDDPSTRLSIFRAAKQAYGVRSRIVHGDVLPSATIVGLVDVARWCDDTARRLLLKVLSDEQLIELLNVKGREALDTHMFELLFGLRSTSTIAATLSAP